MTNLEFEFKNIDDELKKIDEDIKKHLSNYNDSVYKELIIEVVKSLFEYKAKTEQRKNELYKLMLNS